MSDEKTIKLPPVEAGWEEWRPSNSATGVCKCLNASPFYQLYRKDEQLRCSKCVPRMKLCSQCQEYKPGVKGVYLGHGMTLDCCHGCVSC